jgi:signal transduction histidine kinase
MKTLRARLAALLVVAIVLVVALASAVAIGVLGIPDDDRFFDSMARGVVDTARGDDSADWFQVVPQPAAGVDSVLTAELRAALGRMGSPLLPLVSYAPEGAGLLVSVPSGKEGYVVMWVIDPARPAGGWRALLSGMAVIVVGAIILALAIADRMTRPLRMLERAVTLVGADGTLAPLAEHSGSVEVRATARALNRLSSRLKAAMESRMRLVAAAGHDLRTPMTRMRLRAEFVTEEEERAGWLRDLDELDRIADSAISLVREEVAATAAETVHLDELVAGVVDDLRALGMPISVAFAEPVTIHATPWSLRRALSNLAINAATHGGGATVSVAAVADAAQVTIVDDGPGIPPELMDRVFEPFFQVDPARRRHIPGAGLGLAIAKEIVEREGGTITLANRSDGGLRQTVTFPVRGGSIDGPSERLGIARAVPIPSHAMFGLAHAPESSR